MAGLSPGNADFRRLIAGTFIRPFCRPFSRMKGIKMFTKKIKEPIERATIIAVMALVFSLVAMFMMAVKTNG